MQFLLHSHQPIRSENGQSKWIVEDFRYVQKLMNHSMRGGTEGSQACVMFAH
jgi:hypothetical protein